MTDNRDDARVMGLVGAYGWGLDHGASGDLRRLFTADARVDFDGTEIDAEALIAAAVALGERLSSRQHLFGSVRIVHGERHVNVTWEGQATLCGKEDPARRGAMGLSYRASVRDDGGELRFDRLELSLMWADEIALRLQAGEV